MGSVSINIVACPAGPLRTIDMDAIVSSGVDIEDFFIFRPGSGTNVNRKTGGGSLIGVAQSGTSWSGFDENKSWTISATGTDDGTITNQVAIHTFGTFGSANVGLTTYDVPAGPSERKFKFWSTQYSEVSTKRFIVTATLSDASGNQTVTLTEADGLTGGDDYRSVEITYTADSECTLEVTLQTTDGVTSSTWAHQLVAGYVTTEALPAITVAPVTQVVADGGTVTFNTTVVGATSYQWETIAPNGSGGWVNVSGGSGGTSDDYTTGTLSRASDNGRQYRLKATNPAGDIYSNIVEARVTSITTSYSGVGLVTGGPDSFTGEAMTGGPTSGSTDVTVGLSGQSITYSSGSLVSTISIAITGQSVTNTTGNVTSNLSYTLTGISSTNTAGIITTSTDKALTGQSFSAIAGIITANIDKAITGQGLEIIPGDLTYVFGGSDISVELSGITFNLSTGTLTPTLDKSINGENLSGLQGTFGVDSNKSLSTILSVAVGGTLTPDTSKIITGITTTSSHGSLSTNLVSSILGQQVELSQGTLVANLAKDISNILLALASGNLLASREQTLTGINSEFSTGALSASGGDADNVTVALSGQQFQFGTGNISTVLSTALTGIVSTLSQSNISPNTIMSIVGQAINIVTDSIGSTRSIEAAGISVVAYQELLTSTISKGLSSTLASFSSGSLEYSVSLTPNGVNITLDTGNLSSFTNISISGIDIDILQNNLFLLNQILDILNVVFVRTEENRYIVNLEDRESVVLTNNSETTVVKSVNENTISNQNTEIVVTLKENDILIN